jgi:RimJ/RimL family protein N-acetyltransferase
MKLISYRQEHFADMLKWHKNDAFTSKIGLPNIIDEEFLDFLIEKIINDTTQKLLIIEHKEAIIGYIFFDNINKEYETCCLHTAVAEKKFQGTPLAIECVDSALKYAFLELGCHRVSTEVMSNNPKLIEQAIKYGFTQEGVKKDAVKINGKRYNLHQFRMIKKEFKERRRK